MEYVSSKTFKTDLGLAETPETTDPKLAYELTKLYNAIKALALALDTYSGSPIFTVEATETIAGAALVDLYDVGGVLKARNANAALHTKPCKAFAPAGIASGSVGHVILRGFISISGVTPGKIYYTSPSTPGEITATKPAGGANLIQVIGFGLDTTTIFFNPEFNGDHHAYP